MVDGIKRLPSAIEEFDGVGVLLFLCSLHSSRCPLCGEPTETYAHQCKMCGADFRWDKGHCLVCAYLELGF